MGLSCQDCFTTARSLGVQISLLDSHVSLFFSDYISVCIGLQGSEVDMLIDVLLA